MSVFVKLPRQFAADEQGASTVDWVVLTAAIVGMALMVMLFVRDGLMTAGADIETQVITAADLATESSDVEDDEPPADGADEGEAGAPDEGGTSGGLPGGGGSGEEELDL